MAGKETNGFASSDADLFQNASYIIVPCGADEKDISFISTLMKKIGFGIIKVATPEEHDRMIAYTSQLPHVIACAYVLNESCANHKGFSAGSYRDVSRVARINVPLWTELFSENKNSLVSELDEFIENMTSIRNAVAESNNDAVAELLSRARDVKERTDG